MTNSLPTHHPKSQGVNQLHGKVSVLSSQ